MAVVLVDRLSLATGDSKIYDLHSMGAVACIIQGYSNVIGQWEAHCLDSNAANAVQLLFCRLGPAGGGTEQPGPVGFNVGGEQLYIRYWNGSGTQTFTVWFLDTPIRPFGKLPIIEDSAGLGAGAHSSPFPFASYAAFTSLSAQLECTKAGGIYMSSKFGGVTSNVAPLVQVTGATGGSNVGLRVPVINQFQVTFRNDDLAAANSMSGFVWGYLD